MNRRVFGPGLALAALVLWATDTQGLFVCALFAAAVHELGHLAAFFLLGARLSGFSFDGGGLLLRYERALSYRGDAMAALSGPAANFLTAILCAHLAQAELLPERAYLFSGAGIALGLYNLLPALPLDGARALYALLCLRADSQKSARIVLFLTRALGAAICLLGLYIFAKTRYNISMFAQGILLLGGSYAKGTGKGPAEGAEAGALCRRRIRTDQKGPGKGGYPGRVLLSGRLRNRHVEPRREDPLRPV